MANIISQYWLMTIIKYKYRDRAAITMVFCNGKGEFLRFRSSHGYLVQVRARLGSG